MEHRAVLKHKEWYTDLSCRFEAVKHLLIVTVSEELFEVQKPLRNVDELKFNAVCFKCCLAFPAIGHCLLP